MVGGGIAGAATGTAAAAGVVDGNVDARVAAGVGAAGCVAAAVAAAAAAGDGGFDDEGGVDVVDVCVGDVVVVGYVVDDKGMERRVQREWLEERGRCEKGNAVCEWGPVGMDESLEALRRFGGC